MQKLEKGYKTHANLIQKIERERMQLEKGVFIDQTEEGESLVDIDAFNEKNEAVFYFTYGVVLARLNELEHGEKWFFSPEFIFSVFQ